jgi:hypothetical protein
MLIPLAAQGESAGASYERPMVRAPLTLEADPANYDLGFRVSSSRRTPSDLVCLLAGGCVAYYPTKVAFVQEGRRIRLASLLVSRKAPAHRVAGKLVSMDIPYIDLNEVLALDLTWKGTL